MTDLAHLGFEINTDDLKKTEDHLDRLADKADNVQQKFDNVSKSLSEIYSSSNLAANEAKFDQMLKSSGSAADAIREYGDDVKTAADALVEFDKTSGRTRDELGRFVKSAGGAAESVENLDKKTGGVRDELNKLDASAKDTATAFDGIDKASGRTRDELGRFIKSTDDAADALEELDDKADDIRDEFSKLKPAADDAATAFGGIDKASGRTRDEFGRFQKDAGDSAKSSDKFKESNSKLAFGFGGIKSAIATLGIGALFKGALSSANDFEASMNDVEEKLGGTTEDMMLLKETALEMGVSTAFSASQASDAMSALAAKNLEAVEITKLLPDVLNLASAAQISLEDSAAFTTTTLTQFNLGIEESTRVVDLLAAVGDSSGTKIEGLESALSKVGGVANTYGQSLESTAAVIALLADNSVHAEVAGTAMAGMFSKLMIATGDGADALEEYGLTSDDFIKIAENGEEHFIGYADAIDLLSDSQVTNTDISRIFGLEAGKNLVPLVAAGGDAIREYEKSFADASTAQEQSITQMKGMPGAIKNVKSAFEGLQIAVADSFLRDTALLVLEKTTDALRYLATDGIAFVTDKIDAGKEIYEDFRKNLEFSDDAPYRALRSIGDAIGAIGDFLRPAGPLFAEFGGVLLAIGAATAAVSGTAGALGLVAGSVKAIGVALTANPIGLTIAAIGTAAYLIYDNWGEIAAWWGATWESMSDAAVAVADWFVSTWNGIPEWFSGIWDSLKTAGSLFASGFLGDMVDMVDGVKNLWDSFTGLSFEVELPSLSDILGGIGRFYAGVYTFWANLAEFTFGIELPSASEIIAGMKTIIGDIVSGTTSAMLDAGKSFGNTIMGAIGLGAEEETPAAVRSIERVADVIEADTKPTFLDRAKSIGSFFGIGFADGVDDTAPDAATAATNMAKNSVEAVESELQIQSPSRVMRAIGAFVSEGFAIGIESMANRAIEAAKGLSESAVKAFDGISEGLERQLIGLQEGDEALRRYDLAQKGIIGTAAEFVLAEESKIRTLQDEARELEAAEQAQRKFVDGMVGAITQASSVKEAFGNLGSFMSGWIRDKAREFLTNKILAVVGADTSGAEAGLSGFLSTATSLLGNFFKNASGSFGGLFDTVKNLFSGSGGLLSTITKGLSGMFGGGGGGLTSVFKGLQSSISGGSGLLSGITKLIGGGSAAGIGGLSSSFASLAAIAGPATLAVGAIGASIAGLSKITGTSAKTIAVGSFLGGPVGSLLAGVFGGKFENTGKTGIDVGFQNGAIEGSAFTEQKRKKFFRNTYREIQSELDGEVQQQLTDYFTNMNTTIVSAASALGVAGADDILESFTVATERFTGETASDDLAAWLETSTLQAYQHAYTQLGPEVQTIIGGMVDIHTANAEEIAAAFDSVGAAAGTILPELDLLGQMLSGTADEQVAYAFQLSEAMGGVGETMQALDLFAREFAPAGLEAARALETAQASLIEWNNEVNALEFEVPQISATGTANVFASDFGGGGFGATEAPQLGAIDQSVTVTNGYFEALIKNLSEGGAHANVAALALQNFVVSTDSATGAITLNRSGLDEYASALSHGNDVQQAAANALGSVTNSLERFGETSIAGSEGLIDTREEMVNYIEALGLAKDTGEITTAQYVELHAASLQQLDDIIAVENALREQTEIFDSFSQTAQTLGLNFDPANAGAVEMANNLVDMFGSLDAFNASTASYFDNFFSAEEQQKIALAQSAVSVTAFNESLIAAGGSAITGNDQFRQYVEGLDLASATGQQAFLSAMQVQEAFAQVGESGQNASDILAQTPADILSAATAFNATATTAANDAQFMQVAVNEATSQMASTTVNTVSEMNQNVSSLNSAANESTLAMTSAHQQTLASQQQASLAQIKAEDIRARAEQLDLTTSAGRAQYALLQQYADNTIASTGVMVDNVRGQVEFMKDGATAAFTSTKENVISESTQLKDGVAGEFTNTKDIVIGAATLLKDGVTGSFTSTKDITTGAAALLKDGVTGAFISTKDISIGAANESKNSWSSAANGISGSAGSAASALSNTAGALGNIGTAAQAAANSVVSASRSFAGLQASAFNDWFASANDLTNINGSFMTGLDRVPYDGFIAEVHEDEMIANPETSNQLRALGVTATSIPANFGSANTRIGAVTSRPVLPTAPTSNVSDELVREFQAMREELEHLRSDNANLLGAIANSNGAIANGTHTQNMTLKNIEQDQERNRRRAQVNA